MHYAARVDRISGEGAAAWRIHSEAQAALRQGEDVIVMSVGDPDFATPAPIVRQAVRALQAGDTHYTGIEGRSALRRAIAAEALRRGGPPASEHTVIVLAGAQNALFTASLCLFSPGDEVVVLDPMYVTYEATIGVSGAHLVRVPSSGDGGFRPDTEAIEAAITPRTRAILFSTPANPSGVVMSREELARIAEIAKRHDLWVIADEVYAALTFEAEHCMIAGLPGMAERTVTVGSLSKSQAMAGWRIGWMLAPEPLIGHARNLSLCMLYGLPGFIQEAATVALTEARDEMDRMRDIYRRRRDLALAELKPAADLTALSPQAGMFLLIDVRRTGLSALDFAWSLYRAEGVSLLDGAAFGPSTAGFVRLSFAIGDDELREGCRRICRFAERLATTSRAQDGGATAG